MPKMGLLSGIGSFEISGCEAPPGISSICGSLLSSLPLCLMVDDDGLTMLEIRRVSIFWMPKSGIQTDRSAGPHHSCVLYVCNVTVDVLVVYTVKYTCKYSHQHLQLTFPPFKICVFDSMCRRELIASLNR
jgi:hypothetical protein